MPSRLKIYRFTDNKSGGEVERVERTAAVESASRGNEPSVVTDGGEG